LSPSGIATSIYVYGNFKCKNDI